MISDEDKERVRQATDLLQLVSETVELRQRGQDFWGCVICTGVALALRGACLVVPRYAAGVAPLSVLLRVAVPELVYSFLLTGLVYLLFRFACHKFGRIALA